ncbi:MAG: glycoside hydrolase family 13 protein [Muribaculaceae bacterium]|nr:glycoside hydrolase family 13 protein [Muribaculaceae bacterium]
MLASLTLLAASLGAGNAMVDRIDPPCWWVGMENDTLQLMVSGKDIAAAEVKADYPGVNLIESVNGDSKDYKFLYFTISPDTKPGELPLTFTRGKEKEKIEYPLLQRKMKGEEHTGFTAADVLYLLMPDRFAQGKGAAEDPYAGLQYKAQPDRNNPNARHGGNIAGIIDHLDYLQDLGVTAIWVCPVLENDMPGGSYHGYATTDYYRIDPRFGTNEEWNLLIAEAHKRGMKVVMDMIFNHSGVAHPWRDNPPTRDWFNHPEGDVMTNYRLSTIHDPYASEYDKDATVNGWFVPSMPDLNQRNPHLMKYLTQNSIWWVENSGIDGIRMDTYPYADMDGMAGWAEDVMREYPNFNIVGECWYANEGGSAFWQQQSRLNDKDTKLPSVMDFKLTIDGRKYFDEETTPWTGLNGLYDHLAMDFLFPDPQKILTFLDNHDTDRYLLTEPENLDSWKQAVTFLLTSRGIPQLYYGTELLMAGSKEGSDGYVRKDFPGGFPGDTVNAFEASGRSEKQNEAWDYLSSVLKWRRDVANDVIAKGELKHFMPINCVYVYQRKSGDKQVVVILNGSESEIELDMPRYEEILKPGTKLRKSLTGEEVEITSSMMLAPKETLILQNF